MNTLLANQYDPVEGEAARTALTLSVTAQTTRREAVQLQTCIDSVEQQLHRLAIPRAVERRIESFQMHEAKIAQTGEQGAPSTARSVKDAIYSTSAEESSKNDIAVERNARLRLAGKPPSLRTFVSKTAN